jgi:hypothetical protein
MLMHTPKIKQKLDKSKSTRLYLDRTGRNTLTMAYRQKQTCADVSAGLFMHIAYDVKYEARVTMKDSSTEVVSRCVIIAVWTYL